jgi:hypothetical protein
MVTIPGVEETPQVQPPYVPKGRYTINGTKDLIPLKEREEELQ